MVCENSFIYLCSDKLDLKNCKRDKHFNTDYQTYDYDNGLIKSMTEFKDIHFRFPDKNVYIAKKFDLLHSWEPEEANHPVKILEEDDCDIWFKSDRKFKEPRTCVYFNLYSLKNNNNPDPKKMLYSCIWDELFVFHLTDQSHMMNSAAIEFSIDIDQHGIHLVICCYSDSLKSFVFDG